MTESTPASRALAGALAMKEIHKEVLRSQQDSLLKSIFNAAQLKQINKWISLQGDPTLDRSEAIRRLGWPRARQFDMAATGQLVQSIKRSREGNCMTMEERIKHIRDTLIVRDNDVDLVHELRGLLNIIDDAVYRQKIRDAMGWAEIYADPKQCAAWDSEAQSGREAVRSFLFVDLDEAASRARVLTST